MPSTLTYPGVYIEEIPSGVRTIVGVATSITAFVGTAPRGPVNIATTITSYADYERSFGGLDLDSPMSFAVRDFFQNGGSQAVIVRLFHLGIPDEDIGEIRAKTKEVADAATGADAAAAALAAKTKADTISAAATKDSVKAAIKKVVEKVDEAAALTGATKESVKSAADAAANPLNFRMSTSKFSLGTVTVEPDGTLKTGDGTLPVRAKSQGSWGAAIRVVMDANVAKGAADKYRSVPNELFNLSIREDVPGGAVEFIRNLSVSGDSSRRIDQVLPAESNLITWDGKWPFSSLEAAKTAIHHLHELTQTSTTSPADLENAKFKDAVSHAEDFIPSKTEAVKKAEEKLKALPIDATDAQKLEAKKNLEDAQKALEPLNAPRQARIDDVGDGGNLDDQDLFPNDGPKDKKGIYALEQTDLFNLLCVPPYKYGDGAKDVGPAALQKLAAYCTERRAMLIVDSPHGWDTEDGRLLADLKSNPADKLVVDIGISGPIARNAALYFPRTQYPNPLNGGRIEEFAPCGIIAGQYASTDVSRGVWKAPAGLDAALIGVVALAANMTDAENGLLNPLGINCLRSFPVSGRVVWGARTLRGADGLADEYKYVPVRRTALYIEESLYRGTQWAVFEPNDEPLWAQLRLNIGSFMHDLFRQGAFQGRSPREAYFVKCDKETTTQSDINKGIVNVVVGFAPLKPAEFVIIKLQQIVGQLET